jgi:hypothetical protein
MHLHTWVYTLRLFVKSVKTVLKHVPLLVIFFRHLGYESHTWTGSELLRQLWTKITTAGKLLCGS